MIALRVSKTLSPSVVTASKHGLPFTARVLRRRESGTVGQVALVELHHQGKIVHFVFHLCQVALQVLSEPATVDDFQIDFPLRFMNMVLSFLRIPHSIGVVNRICGL
jgi:hypothetical protein